MLFIRPVELEDLDELLRMSVEVGSGMTSMPNDEGAWLEKIIKSNNTFSSSINSSNEGTYFLVAEDSDTNEVVGTSAIYTGVGATTPFYSYKQTLLVKYSKELKRTIEIKILNLVNDFTRASEVGSLFLSADYRHSGFGQFMSRSRYLLMSDFPERFANNIIAEMRGWQDENNRSPFWQALGKKFFELPFENADHISATRGSQFIQDLMPKYPVYLDLLPKDAQECVGKPHKISAKAIHMLEKEGFRYDGYVDVFDGGPTVHCRLEQIQSFRDSKKYKVKINNNIKNIKQRYLISNNNIENYRVIAQPANINDYIAEVTTDSANILQVKEGDTINLFAMMERK